MTAWMLATFVALCCLGCDSLSPPDVKPAGPCPLEMQPYITVAQAQETTAHIVVDVGPHEAVDLAGLCVYEQPDGALVQVVGCYLLDGTVCR